MDRKKRARLNAISRYYSERNARAREKAIREAGLESEFKAYLKTAKSTYNRALMGFCRIHSL